MFEIVAPTAEQQIGSKLPQSVVNNNREAVKPSRSSKAEPESYLNKLCDGLDREAEQDCKLRADKWNRNYNFFMGGLANAHGWSLQGEWKHLSNLRGLYTANLFFEKFCTLNSVLARSNPKFKVTPSSGSGTEENGEDAKRSGAVIAQRITDYDSAQKCPATYRLRNWFFRLLYGTSFAYINFDKDAGSSIQSPSMRPEEFEGGGMNICPNCGMTFPAPAQSPCPQCQEPNTEYFQGESVSDDVLGDYESVKSGDTRLWSPSPWEVGLPSNARLMVDNGELAWDYVSWCQKVRKKRIAQLFGIRDDFSDDLTVPFMLRAQERLERQWTGDTLSSSKDFCVFRRYWLRPYMYHGETVDRDIVLADGTEVAAGTKYIDALPDGMYIARVGRIPLDIQPASIDEHWSESHYTYNPQSPWGKGIEDGADMQVIINALYQIAVEHGKRDAVGSTIFNQNAGLSVSSFEGGKVSPADIEKTDDIRKVAMNLQGNTMNPSLFAGIDMARNDLTAVTNASSVLAGTNETLPDTYGATQLLVQRATSVLTPMFMMDAEQGKRIWEQNLKLRQKYQAAEAFMPFTDENEHEQGRYFSASDIPRDFVVSAVDGSWMPSDLLDLKAELEQAMTMGDIPGGIFSPDFPPEARQVALNVLSTLPRSLNKDEADEMIAHQRMAALKQGLEKVRQMQVPPDWQEFAMQQILTMPSVVFRPDIDSVQVHLNVAQLYAKSLLNDPQADVDYELVALVEQYVQMVKGGGITQAQEQTASMILAQQPQAEAEMAMGALQQESTPPEQPDTSGIEQETVKQSAEIEKARMSSEDSKAQRKHESKENAATRKHEERQAKIQAKVVKK